MNQLKSLIAVALLAVTLASGLEPAAALGERTVSRGCGTNLISSYNASYGGNARTTKRSGSCTSALGAGIIFTDGSASPIIFANNYDTFVTSNWYASGGRHMGCPSCNISYT